MKVTNRGLKIYVVNEYYGFDPNSRIVLGYFMSEARAEEYIKDRSASKMKSRFDFDVEEVECIDGS
jgi:hypothetical protein